MMPSPSRPAAPHSRPLRRSRSGLTNTSNDAGTASSNDSSISGEYSRERNVVQPTAASKAQAPKSNA